MGKVSAAKLRRDHAKAVRQRGNYQHAELTIAQVQSLMRDQGRLRVGGGLNRIVIIEPCPPDQPR